MAKHADPQGVPDTPDEWLDQFGTLLDMYSELNADDMPPVYTASQDDFDRF